MNSLLTAPLCRMKDIILRPHLSVGLSWQDQKSGKAGNDKSLYLSRAMTASDFLLVLLGIFLLCKGILWCYQRSCTAKLKKKYRKKLSSLKEKMSKS